MLTQSNNNDAIAKQLAALKQVCNTLGAYIYTKDIQGRYTYANRAVLKLFNKSLEEVIGCDDTQFFDLDISSHIKENDNQVMQTATVINAEETNYIKSSGEQRIYHTVKSPLFDDDGRVCGICGISTDITTEKRLRDLNHEQKQLLDTVLNNIPACVYIKDEERRFLYANSKVSALFERPITEIIGQLETSILPKDIAAHFHESDAKVFKTKSIQRIEETVIDNVGNTVHYLSVKVPITINNKCAVIGFSTDVTELYELKEQFRQQANTDYLTNLYNRRYFIEQAEREFTRSQRHALPLTIISIDIDHFKHINDNYGHPFGDKILIDISEQLLQGTRQEDVVARIGGDEFAIMLPNTTRSQGTSLAERIQKQLQAHDFSATTDDLKVAVSIGITVLSGTDTCFDELLLRVDKALYQAKNKGRNQVVYL
ncbi:sensor domain-containing diguanylate cyclase [Moritella yayanosii]|uniref:Sensor domain-containing diguanylate cyclase n=1 Tax=Moritella yayanosii TaxID=69539 RepID=A0A330LQI3_9GAMM|nr:diguanylate cyclase [Moritella yayanosii]SQD78231.1 Sensor domain-containing diguanylate cyclase [Moritella yayanosii]